MDQSIAIVITAIATLAAALGLPSLWQLLTTNKKKNTEAELGYKAKLQEMEMKNKEQIQIMELENSAKIQKMEIEMTQFRTGVDMLITIIETEFDDNPNYLNLIEKVKFLIHPNSEEVN